MKSPLTVQKDEKQYQISAIWYNNIDYYRYSIISLKGPIWLQANWCTNEKGSF